MTSAVRVRVSRRAAAARAHRLQLADPRQVQGRQRTEHDARDDRQPDRDQQDPFIDADFVDARQQMAAKTDPEHALRIDRGELFHQIDARRADRGADRAANQRQHEAFGENLADDPGAARADGEAHRELARAAGAPRQEQVGHVGAHDQQYHRHCNEKHPQRRPNGRDQFVDQRDQPKPRLRQRLLGIGPRRTHRIADDVRFLVRRFERDAVAEPRVHDDARGTATGGALERNVEIEYQSERVVTFRQHADDGEHSSRLAGFCAEVAWARDKSSTQFDCRANGIRFRPEVPAPGAVAQHDNVSTGVVAGLDQAAACGLHAQHIEEIRRHPRRGQTRGAFARRHHDLRVEGLRGHS
jgi:hypothetical protein